MSTKDQLYEQVCGMCQEYVPETHARWCSRRHDWVCNNCDDEPPIAITGQDGVEVVELPGIGDE